ncbi:unnamed protein product [Rotaria magnacalcarata]|uniref:Uncharacterized protein n=2 Tax=Rotaria magnacalcarata TaxID=392030 RepID=A0A814DL08_9BILA|nr:unnamed protein product [Rotaria magnacalcarata]
MNTNSNLHSTPETINPNTYIDSFMDFSTPMSTISNRWISNTTKIQLKGFNETIYSDTSSIPIIINNKNIHNYHRNETVFDQLLQKLNQHESNVNHTQNNLHLLDNHLHELTKVLNQFNNVLNYNSSLKADTDLLETRLLQMSIKQKQIRIAIDNFHQSSTMRHALDNMNQKISSRISNGTVATNPMMYYNDLIMAVNSSINQSTNSIERFHHEQNRIKHRTEDYYTKLRQRQELLIQLVEKIIEQQKTSEKYIEAININKSEFDSHREQLAEFNKLTEEYQIVQDENRSLKHKAKENIQILYNFINQLTE